MNRTGRKGSGSEARRPGHMIRIYDEMWAKLDELLRVDPHRRRSALRLSRTALVEQLLREAINARNGRRAAS